LKGEMETVMRPFYTALLLAFLSSASLASHNAQTPRASSKSLTNADVRDMLSAGLSQEIVIAKIAASTCEFELWLGNC
jgi:hypothetical protein